MTTVEREHTTRTEAAEIMPFGGWEAAPAAGEADHEAVFRFPAPDDPAPGAMRLLLMSLCAAVLGLGALGVGIRALLTVIGGAALWYVPVLTFFGLLSLGLTVGAFLSVHRPTLPWLLILAATGPLVIDILIAALY